MGSQLVDILRQGIWASLTGGWYYDPHNRILTNTLHLYLWLALFCLPFSIHLFCPAGPWTVWLAYSLFILVVFAAIKTTNRTLHRLFDTGEVHEVTTTTNVAATAHHHADYGYESIGGAGGIELHTIRPEPKTPSPMLSLPRLRSPPTPPETEPRSGGIRNRRSAAPRGLVREDSSRFDLKVDVHASTQQLAADQEQLEEQHGQEQQQDSRKNGGSSGGDVVIVVEEGAGGQQQRHRQGWQ
jgi:hypothetical protein